MRMELSNPARSAAEVWFLQIFVAARGFSSRSQDKFDLPLQQYRKFGLLIASFDVRKDQLISAVNAALTRSHAAR
jgi:hypothetical protein